MRVIERARERKRNRKYRNGTRGRHRKGEGRVSSRRRDAVKKDSEMILLQPVKALKAQNPYIR